MLKLNTSHVILCFLHLLSQCVMIFAFPVHTRDISDQASQQTSDNVGKITVHTTITGILLIVLGIIYCFFGRKYYRVTMFVVGFYVGSLITWIILENAEPSQGYGNASDTVILIISIFAGVLVGLVFLCCSSVAVWFLGALGGYALALYILSWASGGVIQSRTGQHVFIIAFTIAGLVLAILFQFQLVIFATAFIGAYSIMLGIDLFARTGYKEATRSFLDGNHEPIYNTDSKVYVMLVAQLILFIVGAAVQWRYHRGAFEPTVAPSEGSKKTWKNWYRR